MNEWLDINTFPRPPADRMISRYFLVEFTKNTGWRTVAVCRSYRALLDGYEGFRSFQHGLTFDTADDDGLSTMWTPTGWQEMPAARNN